MGERIGRFVAKFADSCLKRRLQAGNNAGRIPADFWGIRIERRAMLWA